MILCIHNGQRRVALDRNKDDYCSQLQLIWNKVNKIIYPSGFQPWAVGNVVLVVAGRELS